VHDIRVSRRGTPLVVTYRKNSVSPILEAPEILGKQGLEPQELPFLAAAWKAAYAEAKELGWL
jgi:hypothetical protein